MAHFNIGIFVLEDQGLHAPHPFPFLSPNRMAIHIAHKCCLTVEFPLKCFDGLICERKTCEFHSSHSLVFPSYLKNNF